MKQGRMISKKLSKGRSVVIVIHFLRVKQEKVLEVCHILRGPKLNRDENAHVPRDPHHSNIHVQAHDNLSTLSRAKANAPPTTICL